jgi:hypothetical protein
LNCTCERIKTAGRREFAAGESACSRIDPITRCANVNERIVFCCFNSEKGLYCIVLAKGLLAQSSMIESMPDDDFTQPGGEGLRRHARILTDLGCVSRKRSIKIVDWFRKMSDRRLSKRKLVVGDERKASRTLSFDLTKRRYQPVV